MGIKKKKASVDDHFLCYGFSGCVRIFPETNSQIPRKRKQRQKNRKLTQSVFIKYSTRKECKRKGVKHRNKQAVLGIMLKRLAGKPGYSGLLMCQYSAI